MGGKLQPVISLLLPSRQRPEQLARLWNSALDTADKPEELECVVYVDNDDDTYDKYPFHPGIIFIKGPRLHDGKVNLSVKWNECWKLAHGDIFMHCGDDIIFRTKSWDSAIRSIINSYPKNICFVWCNDLSDGSYRNNFGTHGFIHRNWTDVIGRFVPPYFVSDYNDTWFNDVAEKLGVRNYLHEYITEHMHFSLGKAEMDNNTQERLKRHEREHPEELYYSRELRIEREDEIEKLREFINGS